MTNVIPDYDNRGLLPKGEHETSLEEFITRFVKVINIQTRTDLFEKYIQFCLRSLETNALLSHYIDGSYITNKEEPEDVDLLVMFDGITVAQGPDELYDIYLELDNKSDVNIKEKYSCHVWCSLHYPPEDYNELHKHFNGIKNDVLRWWQTNFLDDERTIPDSIPKGVIVLHAEEIEKVRSL